MGDKRKLVAEIIERLAVIYDEEDHENDPVIGKEINKLEEELIGLTGKNIEECEPFQQYWGWTELEDIVDRILMPKPEARGMSDEEIRELLYKVIHAEFASEMNDYWIEVLAAELKLPGLYDYIYEPEEAGLAFDADADQIIEKIFEDRGQD